MANKQAVESKEVATTSNKQMTIDDHDVNIMTQESLGNYCSLKVETKADKVALYNMINNPDKRLSDMINMTINAKHIIAEIVELTQEETGELVKCPRVIIIDDKGVSYQCVSVGIMSGLKRIVAMFGEPSQWDEPIAIKVKSITKGKKSLLTLELV